MRDHRKPKPEPRESRVPWTAIGVLVGLVSVGIAWLTFSKPAITEDHGRVQIKASLEIYEVLLDRTAGRIPTLEDKAVSEFGKHHGAMQLRGEFWRAELANQFQPAVDSLTDRWRATHVDIIKTVDAMKLNSDEFSNTGKLSDLYRAFTRVEAEKDSVLALLDRSMKAY